MTDEPVVYTCANCRGTFETSRAGDDSAHAEAVALWGRRGDAGGMAVLCDACWRRFMAWRAFWITQGGGS